MRMPDKKTEGEMTKSFRPLYINMVAPGKTWEELTSDEKKMVDKKCKEHFHRLQF